MARVIFIDVKKTETSGRFDDKDKLWLHKKLSWIHDHKVDEAKIEKAPSLIFKITEVNQHEQTRQYISEKLEELAKKADLLKAKEEIVEQVKLESKAIQLKLETQIRELKTNLVRFLPYKRVFKTSFYFFCLFIFSTSLNILLSVNIMNPLLSIVGLVIAFGFMVMAYYMYLDWNKGISNDSLNQ